MIYGRSIAKPGKAVKQKKEEKKRSQQGKENMKKNSKQQTKQNKTTTKGSWQQLKVKQGKERIKKKERGKKSNSTELSTSTCNSTGYPAKVTRIKGHLLLTILSHRGMTF